MTEQQTYRPVGRLVLRKIGADQLLVPVSGPLARETKVYPLNATGAFIWEGLSREQSLDHTARALADAFDVELDQAAADCEAFARHLLDEGLLEVAS